VRKPLFFKGLFNAAIMMRLSYHHAALDLTQAAARSARRPKKNPKKFFEIDIEVAHFDVELARSRSTRDRSKRSARRSIEI
jgi:hypothetical protein